MKLQFGTRGAQAPALTRAGGSLEVRDPRAATVSAPHAASARVEYDAEDYIRLAFYSNVYVYAAARARANDLAAMPIRIGADPDKPKDFDPKHPLARLLGPAPGGPTMNISARRLLAWSIVQYDIVGVMAWEIASPSNARKDRVPFELWPLAASRLCAVPATGTAGQWFSGFKYRPDGRAEIPLASDQVMYHWRPAQDDFRRPESVMEAARLNVAVAVMQEQYDYAFLVNDARPATVVVHEAFANRGERNAWRRQYTDTHRGPRNAGKVMFVETSPDGATPNEAIAVKQLGMSQRDAEFIQRYNNEIRAICVGFGTPLSRLADSSGRTYTNAGQESLNYWRGTIKPLAVEHAEAINVGLMPRLDDSNVMWFDTTGIPELEPTRRWAVGDVPALLKARVLTRNDARGGLELAAVEGGDDFEDPAEVPQPHGNNGGGPKETVPATSAPVTAPNADPQRTARLQTALHAIAVTAAAGISAGVQQLVSDQRVALVNRAGGKRGAQAQRRSGDMAALYDPVFWAERYRSAATTWLDGVMVAVYAAMTTAGIEAQVHPQSVQWEQMRSQYAWAFADNMVRSSVQAYSGVSVSTPLADLPSQSHMVTAADLSDIITRISRGMRVGQHLVNADTAEDLLVQVANGTATLEQAIGSLA